MGNKPLQAVAADQRISRCRRWLLIKDLQLQMWSKMPSQRSRTGWSVLHVKHECASKPSRKKYRRQDRDISEPSSRIAVHVAV